MIGQQKNWIGWNKQNPFPQQECFDRADYEEDKVYAVKQIKYTTKENEEKSTNTYNSFKNHKQFIDYLNTATAIADNNHYELIKNECIEYYDFDYKMESMKDHYSSQKDDIDSLINIFVRDFIKQRNTFVNYLLDSDELDKDLYPFYSNISIDDCIILEANSDVKFSIHLLVRRIDKIPIFFISPTEQKRIQAEFQKYLNETPETSFFKIDLSVYNNNSLFRCKGQTKISGEPRILKPWGYQASKITDDRLFLCSYVKNPKGYLSIQLAPEEEKVGKYDDIDYEENSKDVIKLVGLIIESVSSKNNKKLCDTEVPDKICYDKWKCLVFAVFKYLPEDDCEKIFPSLFELYRSHKSYSMTTILRGFLQTKGKYDYSIKSLHYWAYCSENYKTEFKTYYDLKSSKKKKTKEEKFIQDCLKGNQKSFSEFFHFLQKDYIKIVEKDDKKFVYYDYDEKTALWVKHKSIDLCSKISNTIVPYIKPLLFTLQEKIKKLEEQQQLGIKHKTDEKMLNKENTKKQKELDKQFEKEQKEYERTISKKIREFEKENKAYEKRLEKIKKKTPTNLLEEALRQEEQTKPTYKPCNEPEPIREIIGLEKIEEDTQFININETNHELTKQRDELKNLVRIIDKDLEKACFLKGVIEFFNSNSSIDEEFIKALENKPPNLFPFENKVFDFNTGYWRLRTKEDYFNFTTDNKILKLTPDNRKTIEDYITSLITTTEMSAEDRAEHTQCFLTYLAYCLTGDNHLKKILIMKGASGDNGKTCFLNLFKKVLGKFGFEPQKKVFIESKSDSVHQTELFDIPDKRVSYISELTEKSNFNIDLMKFISGDDKYKNARRAGGEENKDLKLDCKLMIITNEVPKFEDPAFSNRLFIIDFCNRFEKDARKSEEILGYKDILFSYLCERATEFYSSGKVFSMSKQSMITTKKEKQDKDTLLAFVQEKIVMTNNPKDKMLRSLFLEEYNNYCFSLDMLKIARNRLYDRFVKEYKIQVYDERYFLGITLVSSNSYDFLESNDPLGGLGNKD